MGIRNEIKTALQAHAAWRERFKDILNGRSKFDLAEISATDKCIFGQWLENEGKRLIPPELHAEISAVHADYHRIATGILLKIREKQFAAARKDIELDGELNQTSLRMRSLVLKIRFHKPSKLVEQQQAEKDSQLTDADQTQVSKKLE
jgi:hypothetical protein